MVKKSLWIAVILLVLSGCDKQENVGEVGSLTWESMPQLTYGVLESEKLQDLDWNSGRCEATSLNSMAETAQGFYCTFSSVLYYADKENPNTWVPVCGKADCNHINRIACDASMLRSSFVVRDNRIFYEDRSDRHKHLAVPGGSDFSILSKAADGSDVRLAYNMEGASLKDGGRCSTNLSSDLWLYYVERLNTDGSTTALLFAADTQGSRLLDQKEMASSAGSTTIGRVSKLYGDTYYLCPNLFQDQVFRVDGEQLDFLDVSLIPDNGGYISGNTMRVFRHDDGYYDVQTVTGETVKVADAQLSGSDGQIYLPNCIVESTLLVDAMEFRTAGMTHAMKIFNGESWKDVALPPELLNAKDTAYVYVLSITSDSILFEYRDTEIPTHETGKILYQISLKSREMVMEQWCIIGEPKEK